MLDILVITVIPVITAIPVTLVILVHPVTLVIQVIKVIPVILVIRIFFVIPVILVIPVSLVILVSPVILVIPVTPVILVILFFSCPKNYKNTTKTFLYLKTSLKFCFLHLPKLCKLIFCTWIKRPQMVWPVKGFVVRFSTSKLVFQQHLKGANGFNRAFLKLSP